jgi:hypothetical protein
LPTDYKESVERTFRPFDELDKDRVENWFLVPLPRQPKAERPMPKTLQALMDQSDSESDAEGAPPLLALEDVTAEPQSLLALEDGDAASDGLWREALQRSATLVWVQAGGGQAMTYIRCHREVRRVQLLALELRKATVGRTMPGPLAKLRMCVRVAKSMADTGRLPSYSSARVRKTEFLKRCCTVLLRGKLSQEELQACHAILEPMPVDPNAWVRNAWENAKREYRAAGSNLKRMRIQLELADRLWGTKKHRRV